MRSLHVLVVCSLILFAAVPSIADDVVLVRTITHLGARYTVVTVRSPADLRLYGGSVGGVSFSEAQAAALRDGRTVTALMNGGMYGPDFGPVGLFVSNGVERHAINLRAGPGNFHLKPNGVFWIDTKGVAHATVSEAFPTDRSVVALATQSGPILLMSGAVHTEFQADSANLLRRNGVGVSADGRTVHLAISEGDVRFHDFATLFRDVLGSNDALFLDGTVSNLWTAGRMPAARYGSVLAVTRPAPK